MATAQLLYVRLTKWQKNLGNLDPNLQAKLSKIDPNNDYLVDWLWGYTTVGINVNKVKAVEPIVDAQRKADLLSELAHKEGLILEQTIARI